ncbi:hypothetical protein FRACYDRAFT_241348 [Fragilariopsis cylindrus CCMP1102]|uniref:Uncharacterized protein n=1 Tax=Fragilariopsis cylindrus CCMP1102 TaxID=635003 RepID=A0A1E7F9I5_9STRA|nr:hypothetical protein FRACYDRAFT_241348 [Fragilariopsis cylindrus CCMP1102]|eukprot:OEU14794.1 hypothetical protein FRACYDRAFT_241348 [Fragilariopsis cylindrus CCMP1102]
MTGREHRPRKKRSATTAAANAAVDRKWKILMALSFAIFAYLVLITQVLEVSTHSDRYDNNASKNDRDSFLKLQQEYSGSRRRNITAIIAELADVPDDKAKATKTAVVSNTDTSTKKYSDDNGQEDKNVRGNNNNTEQEEVYIPRKGQQVTSKQKALKKKRREAKRQQKLMANNNNNDNVTIDMSKWTYEETAIKPNISNDEYYRNIPLEFLTTDDTYYLWDKDKIVPEWMKDYFRWHRYKRSTWGDLLQNENWKQERWLIMQCLLVQDKRKCGGTADRLKPIPALLKKAYDTKRILLIRWTRPTMLEEFLIPPEGGFDWRVPLIMADVMEDDSNGKRLVTKATIAAYAEGGMALVKCRWQTTTPSFIYDSEIFGFQDASNKTLNITDTSSEPNFETVFAHVWKIFFTPSPPVASKIQSKLDAMDLQPNHYVASHFRALYGVAERPEKEIEQYTANAVACATQIRPNVPIFFASDSAHATERALQYNNEEVGSPSHHIRVVTSIPNPNPPWHLDSYVSGPTEKFYDTFIDLYLLALGGCVTYSNGGYGHWGLLIGGNVDCNIRQLFIGRKSNSKKDFCKWSSSDSKTKEVATTVYGNDSGPLFLPPMK